MPDKKRTPPKKTPVQMDVENLLSQPPLISLINHAQSLHSTNPAIRGATDIGGTILSGSKGPARLAGRTMAELPAYHDEIVAAGRTLTPEVSPRYRTNKVGEQALYGLGNFVKDTVTDLAINKVGAKLGPQALALAQKGSGYVNAVTDPIVYGELRELAGYMQKSRPELGGKSIFQSIPGFEDWLTEQAKKRIADHPAIAGSTIWTDPSENMPNKLDANMVVYQLLKLFNPKMVPPAEVDRNGLLDWQANKASFNEPSLSGDFQYKSPGLSNAQQTGARLMDAAEALDQTLYDIYDLPALREYAKIALDIQNKGYPKTIAHRIGNAKIKSSYTPDQSHLKPTKRNSTGQLQQP